MRSSPIGVADELREEHRRKVPAVDRVLSGSSVVRPAAERVSGVNFSFQIVSRFFDYFCHVRSKNPDKPIRAGPVYIRKLPTDPIDELGVNAHIVILGHRSFPFFPQSSRR